MKPNAQAKRKRHSSPLGRLDLRIEVSQDEILADLRYPAPVQPRRRP